MSSSSAGKCPLCFTTILVKNFKRHCDARHNSVDTKEKYEKLLKKLKEIINNQRPQLSTSKLTTSNEPLTPTSNETSPDIIEEEITQALADNECVSSSPDVLLDENTSSDSSPNIIEIKNNICGYIKFILKQTQLASKVIDMSFDETVSTKNFLIETTSSFGKIKESLNDFLVLCNTTLENMPSTSITVDVDKLRSSETIISRDPSTTKIYNEVELRYLVEQGPYQPKLARYPINENLKKNNDTCHFVPRWYNEFPLIEYSPITDSIYCFCCRLFAFGPGCAQTENAWISSGVRTWNKIKGSQGAGRKGKLDVHIRSETHQSSLERYLNFKERKNNVDYMLDKNLQQQEQQKIEQNKSNEEVINILIDCTRYLARQGLAFRGHEHEEGNFHQLVYLLSRHNSLLNDWIKNIDNRPFKTTYMSKDSQNEFIELLGDYVQQENLSDIRKASYYSIMADSAMDSNRQDMLSVFIRFVNEQGEPEERFVSIKQLHVKTGDGIANHLLEVLNELELDTNKLISQSYDFAKNMSGEFNGVQAKLSDKLQRDIKYIPCSSHRSNTVVKHSSEANLDVHSFFGTLQSVYVFFTSSTKRLAVLGDKYSSNVFALTPKTTSTTRWNAKYQSMRAIYESLDEVVQALNTITNDDASFDSESRQEARSINTCITTFNFMTYLVFMKNLMAMTNSITTQFQAERLDLLTAGELLAETVQLLEFERSNDDNLNNIIVVAEKMTRKYGIDPDDEFNRKHRKRRPPKKFDNNPQTAHHFSRTEHYRNIFRQVMDQLIVEYKQISMSIDSNVQSLSKLSPKYIINFIKNDAADICNMLQIDDCNLLFNEVQLLKMKICEFETINLASKFVHERKLYVPLLAQAYEYLLTLPVSVASVERSFSKMKIVKNRLRTKMNDDRLHSLLTCTIETSILDQIDNKKLAQKWSKNKVGCRI